MYICIYIIYIYDTRFPLSICIVLGHAARAQLLPVLADCRLFRGGLVSKAHRRWYHSTLCSKVVQKKKIRLPQASLLSGNRLASFAALAGIERVALMGNYS